MAGRHRNSAYLSLRVESWGDSAMMTTCIPNQAESLEQCAQRDRHNWTIFKLLVRHVVMAQLLHIGRCIVTVAAIYCSATTGLQLRWSAWGDGQHTVTAIRRDYYPGADGIILNCSLAAPQTGHIKTGISFSLVPATSWIRRWEERKMTSLNSLMIHNDRNTSKKRENHDITSWETFTIGYRVAIIVSLVNSHWESVLFTWGVPLFEPFGFIINVRAAWTNMLEVRFIENFTSGITRLRSQPSNRVPGRYWEVEIFWRAYVDHFTFENVELQGVTGAFLHAVRKKKYDES